jgi:hypothetical protein
MDFSWLGKVFNGIIGIFKKLGNLKWSDIWRGIQDILHRLKNWYEWYKTHVQQPIQQARANFRKLFNRFIQPIIGIVDTLRRITSLVGLFNKRLAAKLNSVFFRIEAALLAPMRAFLNRINSLGHVMQAFLTPLGYFDRATLLNSLWRDAKYLRHIVLNPLAGPSVMPAVPPVPTTSENVQFVKDFGAGLPPADSSGLTADLDSFHKLIEAGVE